MSRTNSSNNDSAAEKSALDRVGLANLAVVMLLGGSTFLAIRIAVRPGSGFPALWMSASRFSTASILILAALAGLGRSVRLPRGKLVAVLASGVLLWGGGNGFASIASRTAGAGCVALFLASWPVWALTIESLIDRRLPSPKSMIAIALGVAGVAFFSIPSLKMAIPSDSTTRMALILAPLSYGAGVVVFRRAAQGGDGAATGGRWQALTDTLTKAGWQMLGGSVALWVAVVATGEHLPKPSPSAWAAWAYLVVMGSIVGFAAFTAALERLPMTVFMSHAYVNPLIAAGLGVLVLGESLTPASMGAAFLIVLGTMLLVTSGPAVPKYRHGAHSRANGRPADGCLENASPKGRAHRRA
jgi:drug/metabolite transporter (DMT)-like permease